MVTWDVLGRSVLERTLDRLRIFGIDHVTVISEDGLCRWSQSLMPLIPRLIMSVICVAVSAVFDGKHYVASPNDVPTRLALAELSLSSDTARSYW